MVLGKWNSSKLGHVTRQVGLVLPDLVDEGQSWEVHTPEVAKVLGCKIVFVRHVFQVMESLILMTKIGPQTYQWNGYAKFLPTLSALGWEMKFLDYPQRLFTIQENERERVVEQSMKRDTRLSRPRRHGATKIQPNDDHHDQGDHSLVSNERSWLTEGTHEFWTIYTLSQTFIAICLHQKDRLINLDMVSQVLSQGLSPAKGRIIDRHIRNICHVMTSLKYPLLQRVSIGQFSGKAFQNVVRYVGPTINETVLTPEIVAKLPVSVCQASPLLSSIRLRLNLGPEPTQVDYTGLTILRVRLNQTMGQPEVLKSELNQREMMGSQCPINHVFSMNQTEAHVQVSSMTMDTSPAS
ncbi:uncharacterized protein LOC131892858 [Tigriopus californicus]|uniref:uncharacterized protein LOC131892858 n=1 Tax=Tigriopus californicus TaxID=6832 RepID=UPI0027DA7B65|nr:uncharacterized protein LOC131892858 [Tigriopus californicus]